MTKFWLGRRQLGATAGAVSSHGFWVRADWTESTAGSRAGADLYPGPALRQAVVLGEELLPLVLPQLGRRHVQVDVVPRPQELLAPGVRYLKMFGQTIQKTMQKGQIPLQWSSFYKTFNLS